MNPTANIGRPSGTDRAADRQTNRSMMLLTRFLLCFIPAVSSATGAVPSLRVGQPFPLLSLPLCGDEKAASSIMEFRGRKLMLHLFASW